MVFILRVRVANRKAHKAFGGKPNCSDELQKCSPYVHEGYF